MSVLKSSLFCSTFLSSNHQSEPFSSMSEKPILELSENVLKTESKLVSTYFYLPKTGVVVKVDILKVDTKIEL